MPEWLAARATLDPDGLAVTTQDDRVTYRELDARATRAARLLASHGIGAGERVAVLLGNGLPLVTCVFAVARVGAVLVPLNTRLAPAELAWQLADCRARVLLYDASHADVATTIALDVAGLRVLAVNDLSGPCESDFASAGYVDLAAVHTLIYTSGTTGRPKGALLTYGNHWWSAMGSMLNLGLHDDDRWLAVLPLFHVGGLSILMRGVVYGIPVVVHPSFDPVAVNRAIDEDGVTIVSVVAAMLRRMLDVRGGRPYPPTLRHILLGGGPVPASLLEECRRVGAPVVQTYGLTETASQAVTLSPRDALRKLGSAGKPLLPVELRVECDGAPAPPGTVGEIVLRGPIVSPGYADRPRETDRALRGGWLHTGDLGRLDDEGYLYVLDRRGDLIISGGENVYPAEVEAVLLAHPDVAEAGVVAEDDARWGSVPVAYVVARPGLSVSLDDLTRFCADRLARYKVPARIYSATALPRTASGKLLRRKLGTPDMGEDHGDA